VDVSGLSAVTLSFLVALGGLVAVAIWTDVRSRRIPNWLCGVNALLGLCYSGFAAQGPDGPWQTLGFAALHVAAALVVAMGLFAAGAIGAGDAKYYASMAAWIPIQQALGLLVSVALAGVILLVVFLAVRLPGRSRRANAKKDDFDKLPYGVAIGLGGFAAVAMA
jgi:prepilin peptidase CpaA